MVYPSNVKKGGKVITSDSKTRPTLMSITVPGDVKALPFHMKCKTAHDASQMMTAKVDLPDRSPVGLYRFRWLENVLKASAKSTSNPKEAQPIAAARIAAQGEPSGIEGFLDSISPYRTGAILLIKAPKTPATAALKNAAV